MPVLLATTVYFLLEPIEAVFALLKGSLQGNSVRAMAFLVDVHCASGNLLVLMASGFDDAHFPHELLLLLLKQLLLALTVDV